MRLLLILAVVVPFLVGEAGAAVARPRGRHDSRRPDIITNPDWLSRPTGEELDRYFPPLALMLNISGATRMTCIVNVRGALENCKVTEESPRGVGFDIAAINVATLFRMRPRTRNGVPEGGTSVTIPILWSLWGGAPPPALPPESNETAASGDGDKAVGMVKREASRRRRPLRLHLS